MLHLTIIVTATMVSLVLFGTYVIVHPILGGIAPSSTIKGYIQIDTPGLEKVYKIGQPISFSVLIQGFGLYPCQPPEITIYNNTQTTPVFHYSTQNISCPNSGEHYMYYFPDQNSTFSVTINQTGIYTLDVSLGKDSYQKEFSVIPSTNTNTSNQTSFSQVTPSGPIQTIQNNLRIIDGKGQLLSEVKVGQQVQITDTVQPEWDTSKFVYILQILDKDRMMASLSWLEGSQEQDKSINFSQTWTPSASGNYTMNRFVWQNLTNPNSLLPPVTKVIEVN